MGRHFQGTGNPTRSGELTLVLLLPLSGLSPTRPLDAERSDGTDRQLKHRSFLQVKFHQSNDASGLCADGPHDLQELLESGGGDRPGLRPAVAKRSSTVANSGPPL